MLEATEYIIDVTIRNPGLPSYFDRPVEKVLLNAEKSKRKKYLGVARIHRYLSRSPSILTVILGPLPLSFSVSSLHMISLKAD